jgi:two-component system LytT family response regulator
MKDKEQHRPSWLDPEEIIMIRGESNYSWVYLQSGRTLLTPRTLKYWISRLNAESLIRVHRSFVIHRDRIQCIDAPDMLIRMEGGLVANIARSRRKQMADLMLRV